MRVKRIHTRETQTVSVHSVNQFIINMYLFSVCFVHTVIFIIYYCNKNNNNKKNHKRIESLEKPSLLDSESIESNDSQNDSLTSHAGQNRLIRHKRV